MLLITSWKSRSPTNWNLGNDPRYEGPLVKKWMEALPPVGRLIAWDPAERREVWRVTHPGVESGGVLASAGDLVFQGRSDGIFLAYRASDGKKLWEYDTGTGILAPPVTYMVEGVQYVTVMAGWGGVPGLLNFPGWGAVKLPWIRPDCDLCHRRKRKNWKFLPSGTAAHRNRGYT